MEGRIKLTHYFADYDATPGPVQDNRAYPETIFSILLTGVNQSGQQPARMIIRFRDKERVAANPTISGIDVILDLPKHDFPMVQDMIQKSILTNLNPMDLTASYRISSGNTWVNIGLR